MSRSKAPSSSANDSLFDLRKFMTAEAFQNAGLQKLSPQELASLNNWIGGFSIRLYTKAAKATTAAPKPPSSPDVIESEIDGEFEGWSGETIFKLTNGQIWQQTEYDYEYEYAYTPEVTIYKTSGCYKLKVEDMSDTICVKRIK
jgi:hypothetical protein